MIVLKYVIFILVSVVLAGLSMYFRQNYVEDKKISFPDSIKKHRVLSAVMCIMYLVFAVTALVFYKRLELSFIEMTQAVLLWDAMFLISTIDYQVKKIPNKLLLVLLAVRIVFLVLTFFERPEDFTAILVSSLIGMAVGAFIILVVLLLSKGQVGAGDLKLFAVIGFFYGLYGLIQIMIYSLFLSAIVAIVLLLSRKAKMKSPMPMAPFVFLGLTFYYVLL